MKVLFAVNNENISESIIKKYQQEYKEIISVKNVYYFNAIIKELQRDKTYDRIVVSEDLQPFSNNNYEQIDKFIFEKMDNISDEATNQSGGDIPIILICTDRRAKSDPLLIKLFGIGVYNALIGQDRSITNVCNLLAKPRTKKEAKIYYRIDSEEVDYKVENEGDVSELEIQNILNHYKKLGNNEQRYVEDFDRIASQYTDSQLRLIAQFLPLNVKAVLEANSLKYQETVSFGGGAKAKKEKVPNYNEYNKPAKETKQKPAKVKEPPKMQGADLEVIEQNLSKSKITEPIIVPNAINTSKVKRMQEMPNEEMQLPTQKIGENQNIAMQTPKKQTETIKVQPEQIQEIDDILDSLPNNQVPQMKEEPAMQKAEPVTSVNTVMPEVEDIAAEKTVEPNVAVSEPVAPKRRGRPRKVQSENQEVANAPATPKRGRGRPRKVIMEPAQGVQTQITPDKPATPPVNLFELGEDEATVQSAKPQESSFEDMFLPGLDEESLFAEKVVDERMPMIEKVEEPQVAEEVETPNMEEPQLMNEPYTTSENSYMPEQGLGQSVVQQEPSYEQQGYMAEPIQQTMPNVAENNNPYEMQDNQYYENNTANVPPYGTNALENTNTTINNGINSFLTGDRKVVAFVGTSKNGTSFLVNNMAELLSQKGINTAILDLTKNKNAYYIYTENEEPLRKVAYSCIENLRRGNPTGIQVHKNLTVYTTLPGEEDGIEDYTNILQTLVQNYSLVILDCDFETDYSYFREAQELYLVQSLDVLTIQPLTAFLRNLKARDALNPEKIRVVLNKVMRLRSITEKTIIGGMAFYNDPAMSFMTELFNKDTVTYCSIPFEEQAYSKYLEGLINCKISLNGYSKNFMAVLNKLGDMMYPLLNSNNNISNKKGKTYNNYNNYNSQNTFSSNMNSTLNKMKNNY